MHGRHHPPPPHPPPNQHVNTRERKQKSHSHGRHQPPPPAPHRKNRCSMRHTQENPEKNDAKCRSQRIFAQCSPAAGTLFCYKTPQKPMRKQKQSSIPGEQSAKTRVSAHASKGIAPPRAAADATTANNNNHHHHHHRLRHQHHHRQHHHHQPLLDLHHHQHHAWWALLRNPLLVWCGSGLKSALLGVFGVVSSCGRQMRTCEDVSSPSAVQGAMA